MGIKYFTEEEIEYLSSNIYVESVNEKQIQHTQLSLSNFLCENI